EGAEPLGPALDLLGGLLGGDVQAAVARPGQPGQRLEQQRGLADAGLAAEERDRAGHDPALEDAIELAHAAGGRGERGAVHLADRHRGARSLAEALVTAHARGLLDLLDEGVPRTTAPAA